MSIRVFLIDDHRVMLWGLTRLIESAGSSMQVVGSAVSCAEALKLMEDASPDLILLEIGLCRENGVEELPKLLAKSGAKVLVLTGVRDQSMHDGAMLAGARGVLEKSAPADSVLRAIEKVHEGQIWLDRAATGRIFVEFSREGALKAADPNLARISSLTKKERALIAVMANNVGATAKSIARTLFISEHTVRNHLTSIYNKLKVANRLELFEFARSNGLTQALAHKSKSISSSR